MLQSEFENLTDIFPDICLYEIAECEYENGGWTSKAEFCNAYKFDEDGLAQKIQRAANERLWQQEEREQQLLKECAALREQLSAAQERGDRFIEKCNVYRRTISEMKAGGIKADMFDILCQMEKYEYSHDEIFAAFSAFEMFLQKQNTEK